MHPSIPPSIPPLIQGLTGWLALRLGWLALKFGWLSLGLCWLSDPGGTDVCTYVGTDKWTENIPILQDFFPYWGHCPKRKEYEKIFVL